MYPRVVLLAITLLMSSVASSEEFDILLGNESARFMYTTEAFGQDFGRLETEAGFLYTEGGNYLINAGLLVRGEGLTIPMIISIGARAYFAKLTQYDIGAIAIGIELFLTPDSWEGVGVGINYHTAPGVVAFLDAEDLTEFGFYINYQLTQQAKVSLGYRTIDVKIANNVGKVILDDGGYFGLNIEF